MKYEVIGYKKSNVGIGWIIEIRKFEDGSIFNFDVIDMRGV